MNYSKYPISRDQMVSHVNNRLSAPEIAAHEGCSVGVIYEKLRKYGLKACRPPDKRRTFKSDDEIRLKRLYEDEGFSSFEIADKEGVRQSVVYNALLRAGCVMRDMSKCRQKYRIIDDYFAKIDTEKKAYFLGLFYADGGVNANKRPKKSGYIINLGLTSGDEYLIEEFRNEIYPDRDMPLQKRSRMWVVSFSNIQMYHDLVRQGCFEKKSLTLLFPREDQVPTHLLSHFIRGYFDGDGCICINRKTKYLDAYFNIVSSKDFVDGFVRAMEGVGILTQAHGCKHSPQVYYATASKQDTLCRFYEYLYSDATVYMTRKKALFDEAVERATDRLTVRTIHD